MTIEHLKDMAQKALEHGIESMREKGDLHMMFHLIRRDGGHEIIMCAEDVTNSEEAKSQLGRGIRARVQAGELEAVILVSDSYIAETTREQDAVRRAFRMTIEECWKAGMMPKREAVMVSLDSALYSQTVTQEYKRIDGGRAVELVGAPVCLPSTPGANGVSGAFGGRFMGLFKGTMQGEGRA